jgi:signal transduction histidine kinase
MSDSPATDLAAELAAARAELARTSAELAARRAEAAAAGRARSEFLATMSHELRTPLNAVLGYAQLLDMGVLGPATQEQQLHLSRLQTSARHLLRLVDDVLDIAKVDADRMQVRRDVLVTGAAVSAAVALVQPEATARGVRLVDAGADRPGFPYLGDEHRVRQILVNLLSNAVKFTPPGGSITVDCGWSDDDAASGDGDGDERGPELDHGRAFIRVRDTGAGVAAEMQARIFEPFVQGESGLTRGQGGTGLGLAISRRLAHLMGGDITLESEPGEGSTFTLWLPRPPRDAASVPARETNRRTPTLGARVAEGKVLDDGAFAIVRAIGARLGADTEVIAVRYVAALRERPEFPGVQTLPEAQIRDHVTPFIGLLAGQLMTIGEMHGHAPELLADSGQVQRFMAELHGVQRRRLGWSEDDLRAESPIILGEIQRAIRNSLVSAPTTLPESGQADAAAIELAMEYALDLARHVLDRALLTALKAFRFAAATDEVWNRQNNRSTGS